MPRYAKKGTTISDIGQKLFEALCKLYDCYPNSRPKI